MNTMLMLPKIAALELTYQCNHRCFFCSCPWENEKAYQEDELTYQEWFQVIDTLLAHGVSSFTLTGGEPLTRKDIKKIIEYIAERNIPLVLISNGRVMDEAFIEYLSHYDISLCISVPGIKTFQEHTGVDHISHVLGLFELAKKYGLKATANIAVTKKNLPELYENVALPLIHGAEYVLLNRFLPGGRGLSNTEYLLSLDETNEMLEIAESVLSKANRYGHVGTELPLCAIKNAGQYQHLQISSMCAAAKGFFIVDPSGYVKVCNHSPAKLCHYKEIEILENHPYWVSFCNRTYTPKMCEGCEKRSICDGGCREAAHVYYGSTDANDPIFGPMKPPGINKSFWG